jgi:hypothetical protein
MTSRSVSSLMQTIRHSKSLESVISVSILALLIIAGIVIFFQQFRYDEKIFNTTVMQSGVGAKKGDAAIDGIGTIEIVGLEPEGFEPMSDRETFDKATLSDKIDGKADLYLEAGFIRLITRRFMSRSNPANWFEFYLYDMGLPRNAFSVYSMQKRENVTDQDFTEFAYSTENAVFFAHGNYYVEIIAALEDASVVRDMISMSKNYIAGYPEGPVELPELTYLPAENLNVKSISLILKNGFGYKDFNNIFTGTYTLDGRKILAFVSLRGSAEQAESLAAGYDSFISEFIGPERLKHDTEKIPGLTVADIFGEYEIFFVKGNVIAGIHAAQDRSAGEQIALKLYKEISGLEK